MYGSQSMIELLMYNQYGNVRNLLTARAIRMEYVRAPGQRANRCSERGIENWTFVCGKQKTNKKSI